MLMVCVVLYASLPANAIQSRSETCKNSKNMKTVKIFNVQKEPTNVCQLSQLPEGTSLDGVVIQLSRCLSGLVVIIMIGYGLNFFSPNKKAINRKGQIYSNESAAHFGQKCKRAR